MGLGEIFLLGISKYVENKKKYVGNTKKYVGNMKKYVGNMMKLSVSSAPNIWAVGLGKNLSLPLLGEVQVGKT